MRRWYFVSAVVLACSPALAGADTMPKDPATLDIADVFSHTCLHNGGQPARVAAWARQQKLPQLGPTDARKALLADGPEGRAWLIRGPATNIYLAVRGGATGTCAVYGDRADADDFSRVYDEYLQFLAPQGARIDRRPDRLTQGPFGTETERSATIHVPNGKLLTLTMTADQKPGAPYQASLLMATQGAK